MHHDLILSYGVAALRQGVIVFVRLYTLIIFIAQRNFHHPSLFLPCNNYHCHGSSSTQFVRACLYQVYFYP